MVPRAICDLHGRIVAFIVRSIDGGLLLYMASLAWAEEVESAWFNVRPARDFRGFAGDSGLDSRVSGRESAGSQQFLRAEEDGWEIRDER